MPIPTPPAPQHLSPLISTEAIVTQLCVGPAFREVAAKLLLEPLQQLYPTLEIDPATTLVGSPAWDIVEDQVVATPTQYETLANILARQSVQDIPLIYIEGVHFLTQPPVVEPAAQLPVRICEIANLINVLAPVMLSAYQEQQIEYWNSLNSDGQPRWHELAGSLRSLWGVEKSDTWNDLECSLARKLHEYPNRIDRQANDPFNSRAYLIDFDRVVQSQNEHLEAPPIAVLIGDTYDRRIILTYSLLNGYEWFKSMAELELSLPGHLDSSLSYQKLKWRLVEPEGNFFDQQACALIAYQIDAIKRIGFSPDHPLDAGQAVLSSPVSSEGQSAAAEPNLSWFYSAMPQWLTDASTADLTFYSRHLKDLAALHRGNAGRTYQDDIPPIHTYALDALRAAILKDHPQATTLQLERYRMRVESLVMWGSFIPGQVQTTLLSFADLALQNLIALPLGNKSIQGAEGVSVPNWMTVDYIEGLVTAMDLGSAYPALVKQKLLDDPQQSLRRQALFSNHLRIQLPLLALQSKICNEAGIDERGYRYVVALMASEASDQRVNGQTIVIRPLAFAPSRRTGKPADVVANMFVIGPRDMTSGPCLLYRPLLDQPLSQHPSPANLIYAIQQSASLRESVLAWLPDAVREDYARYVFPPPLPSPWTVVDVLVEPDKLWSMSGPLALGEDTVAGDIFAALFTANAKALVELANRQSVSNADSRWATFKHAGWLIFNCALPFLGPTVGIGAWIWQVLDQLQALADAQEQHDTAVQWSVLADLFLNLGMAITLHIAQRNRPALRAAPESEPLGKAEKGPVRQLATMPAQDLPPGHIPPLVTSGALNRAPNDLVRLLDGLGVAPPEGLAQPDRTPGPYQHLYRLDNKLYAPIGERWFQVQEEDGNVMIHNPRQEGRTGPLLTHNAKGEWFVDVRLRLRGGGPKAIIVKARAEAQAQATALRNDLATFERNKAQARKQLQQSRQELLDAPSTSATAQREAYLQTLQRQRTDYENALQKLKALNVLATTADYQQKSIGYLRVQLELTGAGIQERLITFTPRIKAVLEQIERQAQAPQERHIDDAREMNEMCQDMIARLDYVQSRFTELKELARDGMLLVRETQRHLPAYSSDDLKALQVTLARNLCLAPESVHSMPAAWTTLDQIVDAADIAIQSLRDTAQERNESRLDERIETLGSLIEQFDVLDERIIDLPEDYTEHVVQASLDHLRTRLKEYRKHATRRLARLHNERSLLRTRARPPSVAPRPRRKFIRTRYNGVLIGEPRISAIGLETGLVDITSPLTNKVIATFHEKQPGVWVQHLETVDTPTATPDLDTSLNAGQSLLDSLADFKQRANALASLPGRTAIGIEFLFHQHAQRLETVRDAIEQALTRSNATESGSRSAANIQKALDESIDSLYQQANTHMLTMLKRQPPTIANLEWLNNQGRIIIEKNVTRRHIKAPQPDFLDEYSISDAKTHQVLWYAHFRYSTSWTPAKAFISARLIASSERIWVPAPEPLQGLDEQQRIAYYRSEINLEQATRLFFNVKS